MTIDRENYIRNSILFRLFQIQYSSSSIRGYMIRGVSGTFVLQIVSTALGFMTNVLIARLLGVKEYGIYIYIFAWVGILSVLSMSGLGNILIREIAAYKARKEWGLIHGLLRWSCSRGLIVSIIVTLIAGGVAWLLRKQLEPGILPALWAAFAMLPMLTLFNLNAMALQGFKYVVLSKIPAVLIRSPLLLILLVLASIFFPQVISAFGVVLLSGAALLIAFVAGGWLLYKRLPREVILSPSIYQQRIWMSSALPLLLTAGLFELNTRIPTLMLGSMADIEAVGVFGIASLIAGLTSFILLSVNSSLGPLISDLYTSGKMFRLQNVVTLSARLTLLVGGLVSLVIIMLQQWIYSFFGHDFQQAGQVLLILISGQIINIAAGSVGILLVMTGHERIVAIVVGVSTTITIILSVLLIPPYGINGAGIAVFTGVFIWNAILIFYVIKKLGIDPTVFGVLSNWREE